MGIQMPPSKKKVIESLAEVKNLGEKYATAAYEELGVRTVDDLIAAAKDGKLQTIKGIGAAKEKAILKSAQDQQKSDARPAPAPEKKSSKSTKSTKGSKAAKGASKSAKGTKAAKSGAKAKGGTKAKGGSKAKTEKPKAKTEAPKAKAEAPKAKNEQPKAKSEEPKAKTERPRTTYRPPQPKPRPSIPGLIFKLTKKIIGRILS